MGHRHHKENTAKKLAIGGTVAAVAGFVAGVLTAPKSGNQTRRDLKNAADRRKTQAERDLKKLHTELAQTIDETKSSSERLSAKAKKELDSVVTKAQDSREKVREVLSAFHEGETGDKDLKKAIEDANAAIEHLRTYIKK